MSRRHARLFRTAEGRLAVEDLGSANGTLVNGKRISGIRLLQPGDRVRPGRTELEVRHEKTETAAVASPPTQRHRRHRLGRPRRARISTQRAEARSVAVTAGARWPGHRWCKCVPDRSSCRGWCASGHGC